MIIFLLGHSDLQILLSWFILLWMSNRSLLHVCWTETIGTHRVKTGLPRTQLQHHCPHCTPGGNLCHKRKSWRKLNHANVTLDVWLLLQKKKQKEIYTRYSLLVMLDTDVYLLLYFICMCVRFHMGQKSQCHIYPRLTGKLVKLMSKVRYISEKP